MWVSVDGLVWICVIQPCVQRVQSAGRSSSCTHVSTQRCISHTSDGKTVLKHRVWTHHFIGFPGRLHFGEMLKARRAQSPPPRLHTVEERVSQFLLSHSTCSNPPRWTGKKAPCGVSGKSSVQLLGLFSSLSVPGETALSVCLLIVRGGSSLTEQHPQHRPYTPSGVVGHVRWFPELLSEVKAVSDVQAFCSVLPSVKWWCFFIYLMRQPYKYKIIWF